MTRYQRHNDESVYATTAVGSSGRGLKIKRFLSLFQVRQRFLFVQRAEQNVLTVISRFRLSTNTRSGFKGFGKSVIRLVIHGAH